MIVLLIGGPHDGLMVTVNKGHPWLTDDGELRLPYDTEGQLREDPNPTKFAIYSQVIAYGQEHAQGAMHKKGAFKFSRYWTRPEELT